MKRKPLAERSMPDGYTTACIVLYPEDVARLDELIAQFKKSSIRPASASAVIRKAIEVLHTYADQYIGRFPKLQPGFAKLYVSGSVGAAWKLAPIDDDALRTARFERYDRPTNGKRPIAQFCDAKGRRWRQVT